MSMTACNLMIASVVVGVLGVPLMLGFFVLFNKMTECLKRQQIKNLLRNGVAGVTIMATCALCAFFFLNVQIEPDCKKPDSITRMLGVSPSQQLVSAGIPCSCGCGRHK
jgi:hypothetical protein